MRTTFSNSPIASSNEGSGSAGLLTFNPFDPTHESPAVQTASHHVAPAQGGRVANNRPALALRDAVPAGEDVERAEGVETGRQRLRPFTGTSQSATPGPF